MSASSAIIRFAFVEHKEFICSVTGNKKHTAKCKFCAKAYTDVAGTTSNFSRHLSGKHKAK